MFELGSTSRVYILSWVRGANYNLGSSPDWITGRLHVYMVSLFLALFKIIVCCSEVNKD